MVSEDVSSDAGIPKGSGGLSQKLHLTLNPYITRLYACSHVFF